MLSLKHFDFSHFVEYLPPLRIPVEGGIISDPSESHSTNVPCEFGIPKWFDWI